MYKQYNNAVLDWFYNNWCNYGVSDELIDDIRLFPSFVKKDAIILLLVELKEQRKNGNRIAHRLIMAIRRHNYDKIYFWSQVFYDSLNMLDMDYLEPLLIILAVLCDLDML